MNQKFLLFPLDVFSFCDIVISRFMRNWVEISKEEKSVLAEIMKHQKNSAPQFFTLESDKDDVKSDFVEMSREDILKAAENSARFVLCNNASVV